MDYQKEVENIIMKIVAEQLNIDLSDPSQYKKWLPFKKMCNRQIKQISNCIKEEESQGGDPQILLSQCQDWFRESFKDEYKDRK